jgi:hypothetical protein
MERWKELCEQASTERDSEKLLELVREINDLVQMRQVRLRAKEADERNRRELIAQPDKA